MGIEQLVDAFKGNPAPLEAKVQKDQQGQPPGAIPKDLEEAMALQKITEIRNGAQNQQAMQAGGAQPSVVEKLRQMLASAEQRQQAQPMPGQPPQFQPPQGQPQMAQGQPPMPQGPQGGPSPAPQGQPVMAAHGGSIDQLMSNLGRHYAGGGIIAFNGEDGSDVEDKAPLRSYSLSEQGADWEARRQAERDAKIRAALEEEVRRQALLSQIPTDGERAPASTGAMPGETERNISNAMAAMPGASAAKGFAGGIRGLLTALSGMGSGNGEREAAPKAAAESAYTDPETEKLKRLAAARAQTGRNTNPDLVPRKQITGTAPDEARPAGGGGGRREGGGGAAAQQAVDPNSLRALIEANIRKDLGKDEDAEWRKGAGRYEEFVGLDKLLQPREARIAEREAMLKKIQGERTPTWVEALSAAGKPVRGGLGTLLNQMGGAAEATRKGYSAEDLKFFDEIGGMRDEIAKLKLEGKYKAAAAAEANVKDMIATKRQAEQSGTSILNTDEQTATRKQIAREGAANRAAAQQGAVDQRKMANAINAAKNDEVINRLQKDADALSKSFASADKIKLAGILKQIDDRQNAIYKQFGVLEGLSTMTPAPSAASPSGTSKPGWGIKPI